MDPWQSIVDSHAGLVWQTIRRLIDREEDAADCFQDTFAAAFAANNRQPVRHWPAFLVRVATNQALDRLRSRARERTRMTHDHDFGQTASRLPEPAAIAEERELVDRLRHAVATLPKDQAEAFWLATFESLPHAEIGTCLGITANHVGVLLHRARRALQSLVAPSIRATQES
jgi:RNA polymerase sigma-70 factor (ECF subfamily)